MVLILRDKYHLSLPAAREWSAEWATLIQSAGQKGSNQMILLR